MAFTTPADKTYAAFKLSIFNDAFGDYFKGMFTPITGHLFYHISDGEIGTNQNETQRWFEGFCVERS